MSVDGYERRILRAIRRVIRSVDIYSRKLALDHGVTVPQLTCLLRVAESGPLTLKALAEQVDLTPGTVVGIVDRLERKRLVRRTRSQTDRRQVQISITDEGKSMAAGAPSPLHDRLTEALDSLQVFDRAAMALYLERIVGLMEIGHVDAAPILDTGVTLEPINDALTASATAAAGETIAASEPVAATANVEGPPAGASSAPAVSDA